MQDEHDFLSFYLSISRLGVKLILVNENKIYIRVEFSSPLVWILSVPFSLKGSSKCTNHVNVHKLYAVEYINTVCSLD